MSSHEINGTVIGTQILSNTKHFEITCIDERKNYLIPVTDFLPNEIIIGQTYNFYKRHNKINKKTELNLIREILELKLIGIETSKNEGKSINYFILDNLNNETIRVKMFHWQDQETWSYETVFCQIKKYSNDGKPLFINKDFRHPYFETNQSYTFKVLDKEKFIDRSNSSCYRLKLQGIDKKEYFVNLLPGQTYFENEIICIVKHIGAYIKLSQEITIDPYFKNAEEVINDKKLRKLYFDVYWINETSNDIKTKQFIDQYNTKSAYWVFTYVSFVLPRFFYDSIKRQDIYRAVEINSLMIKIEKWIFSKGLLRSLPEDKIEQAKSKIKQKIAELEQKSSVLNDIISNNFEVLNNEKYKSFSKKALENIYYYFSFSDIMVVDAFLFSNNLKLILENNDNETSYTYLLNKLLKIISYKKIAFKNISQEGIFSITSNNSESPLEKNNSKKYLIYTYCEIIITDYLNENEQKNILIGHLFRSLIKNNLDVEKKRIYLINAFYHLDHLLNKNPNPFILNQNKEIEIKKNFEFYSNSNQKTRNKLLKLFNEKSNFLIRATRKNKYGFEVIYDDFVGFLPYSLVKDKILKSYPFGECDFTINVRCVLFEKTFNYFIVDEIITNNEKSNIIYNKHLEEGKVYDGYVKDVNETGIFISTICGDGLLYRKNIFDFYWDYNKTSIWFKRGTKIKVFLITIDSPGLPLFSFKKIKEIDPLYYDSFINNVNNGEDELNVLSSDEFEEHEIGEDTYFDKCQLEIALCFEDNISLQSSIEDKLQNLRIARYFYSNVKNARSFLLNIYVDLFQVVLKIEESIKQKSILEISTIKDLAKKTVENIDKRTMSTFSDTENVIKFLELISLFNELDENTNVKLFDYLYSFANTKNHRYLKIIAKIILANNLLIQESKIDQEFCLKNLGKILHFINSGILNLSETLQDKYDKELQELILYWRQKIQNDENQTLEFKSSLFTPIPDEKNKRDKSHNITPEEYKNKLIHSAFKTLAGFANSNGGILIIGVDNEKKILGLENEFSIFPDLKDGYGKNFDNLIKTYFGDAFSTLLNRFFLKFPEGEILIIEVKKSQEIIFIRKDEMKRDNEQLFIRRLSSTIELKGSEIIKFNKTRDD